MPVISGLELQQEPIKRNISTPIIFITGHGDISMSVKAIKSGAVDFLEKPLVKDDLLNNIHNAIEIDTLQRKESLSGSIILERFRQLTKREKEVLQMLNKDHAKLTNQDIADELGISKRTVEVHRSNIMTKMNAQTRA